MDLRRQRPLVSPHARPVGRGDGRAVAVAPGVDQDAASTVGLEELLGEVLRIAPDEQRTHGVGERRDLAEVRLAVERGGDVESLRPGRLHPAREAELIEKIAHGQRGRAQHVPFERSLCMNPWAPIPAG